MENNETPKGWGKTGPRPKRLKEKVILGLEVGRGENREIVPPEDVYKLKAIGCTNAEIAAFYGINQDTLQRNFKSQLAKGAEWSKIRLRKAMFENACDNMHAAVQIFLAKNILGYSDSPVDSEANTPLPWREDKEEDLQLEEEIDSEENE